jgi:hypothetical protein
MTETITIRTLNKKNTSGYEGVSFDKRSQKYRGAIRINGKNKHLGRFNTPEEANQAVEKIRKQTRAGYFNTPEEANQAVEKIRKEKYIFLSEEQKETILNLSVKEGEKIGLPKRSLMNVKSSLRSGKPLNENIKSNKILLKFCEEWDGWEDPTKHDTIKGRQLT